MAGGMTKIALPWLLGVAACAAETEPPPPLATADEAFGVETAAPTVVSR